MKRLIFHIDVNSAFLSWEAARRVAEGGEDLRLVPSAIGGDPLRRTGVILAKSIPAKAYGVKTGEPVGAALRKCPNLVLAKPDFNLYEKSSKAFMDVCRAYAPVVEQYSIDECFLDMSGTERIYPDPIATAYTIKNEIRDTLGFTVNVGVGSNKLLAKMAGDFEKPDKVHTLFSEEIPTKLWPLPVRDLLSVGGATADKLERRCILTIGNLAQLDLKTVQAILGVRLGQQLHEYANGIDNAPVQSDMADAKGYSNSTTLPENVTSVAEARRILLALSDSVASRARADRAKGQRISVTIRSYDFKTRSHQRKLSFPTDITSEIYDVAQQLFIELWDGSTPLRLLGVGLSDVSRDGYEQESLFPDEKREREKKIDKAIDAVRNKYGADAIMRASTVDASASVGRKHKAQFENERRREKPAD